jgi:hypothetical protein
LVDEDLDFTAKKKAMALLSPKGARIFSGLLYARYRQLLDAKCFRAGVELIPIDPVYTSTAGPLKYATQPGCLERACCRDGVVARREQKLTERLLGAGTVIRVPGPGRHPRRVSNPGDG